MRTADFVVIGAGVSGAAAAWELAAHGSVVLLEAEERPGYHATGRSAALYTPNFGAPLVRAISAAGRDFFERPQDDFADAPLVSPRGALTLARPGEEAALDAVVAASTKRDPILRIGRDEAIARAPAIRAEMIGAACYEPGVADMDVAAIHHGFLRGLRRRGGALVCGARARSLDRADGAWTVAAGGERYQAPVIVNAAGAWGDVVAALAGAAPVGLTPKRRTAIVTPAPSGMPVADMPLIEFAGDMPYLKPDGGRVMASLGDETAVAPHDVQPNDLDVAVLADWLARHTHVAVRVAPKAWAGLRSFTSAGTPVVGFDPVAPGFFWLVGQGGYGIMMAPTLARICADLALRGAVSPDLTARGLDAAALAPSRAV